MMGLGDSEMCKVSSDSLVLDIGVTPCAPWTPVVKRLNRETQPRAAPPPSVNHVRGGKVRGKAVPK